jgi:hypothetical protein
MAYARPQKVVLGAHTLVLTDEGLIERTEYNETLRRWKGLNRVRESGRYLFLQVSEMQFHVIPKRSFVSNDDIRAFCRKSRVKYIPPNPNLRPELVPEIRPRVFSMQRIRRDSSLHPSVFVISFYLIGE